MPVDRWCASPNLPLLLHPSPALPVPPFRFLFLLVYLASSLPLAPPLRTPRVEPAGNLSLPSEQGGWLRLCCRWYSWSWPGNFQVMLKWGRVSRWVKRTSLEMTALACWACAADANVYRYWRFCRVGTPVGVETECGAGTPEAPVRASIPDPSGYHPAICSSPLKQIF